MSIDRSMALGLLARHSPTIRAELERRKEEERAKLERAFYGIDRTAGPSILFTPEIAADLRRLGALDSGPWCAWLRRRLFLELLGGADMELLIR